mgnify:CR=1 FL=1
MNKKNKIKLSTAIREGAKIRKQGFTCLFSVPKGNYNSSVSSGNYLQFEDHQICSCALGAAIEFVAKGKSRLDMFENDVCFLDKHFKGIREFKSKYDHSPINKNKPYLTGSRNIYVEEIDNYIAFDTMYQFVFKLNDNYRLTREKIADILERLGY